MAARASVSRRFRQPFAPSPRHPWVAALLLGTVATPAGVVLGWLAPRPLDAVVALPLVLLDIWVAPALRSGAEGRGDEAALLRLLALVLGIVLTWVFYVLVARLVLWWGSRSDGLEGGRPGPGQNRSHS
jgi:hypothetical protein